MKKIKQLILFTTVLLLSLLLGACNNKEAPVEPEVKHATVIESSIEPVTETVYKYVVTNNTDKTVEYEFTSGQRFDFSISSGDEVIHKLSTVSTYLQALGTETIEPGASLEYEFELPVELLEPGTYTVKAWLTPSEGLKYEAETEYTHK